MDHKYAFKGEQNETMVYVRPVPVADLPEEFQEQTGDLTQVYAVHDFEGQRLAIVENRALAFVLARQHELSPVSVH